MGLALRGIAETARQQSDHLQARSAYENSLTLFTELGDPGHILDLLLSLASLENSPVDVQRAGTYIRKNFRFLLESVPKSGFAACLGWLAEQAMARQHGMDAVRLLGAAQAVMDNAHLQWQPRNRVCFENTLTDIRAQFSEVEFTKAWNEGQSISQERLVELVQTISAG